MKEKTHIYIQLIDYNVTFGLFVSGYSHQRSTDAAKWPKTADSYTQQQAAVARSTHVSLLCCCNNIHPLTFWKINVQLSGAFSHPKGACTLNKFSTI